MNEPIMLSSTIDLTQDLEKLAEMVEIHTERVLSLNALKDYYEGRHKILDRVAVIPNKPNNKIVTNFCKRIVETKSSYFLGKPLVLKIWDEDLSNALSDINELNDANQRNKIHSTTASIYGVSYEICYIKDTPEGPSFRFVPLSPLEFMPIYSNDIEPEVLYGLRPYMDGEVQMLELYTKEATNLYSMEAGFDLIETTPHYYGEVPAIVFLNNPEGKGDFEQITTLQDDYNEKISEVSSELSEFREATLVLRGLEETTGDDIDDIRSQGVMMISPNGEAFWLIKPINAEAISTHQNRIRSEIFNISGIPDFSSESFVSNLSGTAISHKLNALEEAASSTEPNFRAAFRKRYSLAVKFLNKLGNNFDILDIEFAFVRNVRQNLPEIADALVKLRGIISHETLLSMVPSIDNVKDELQLIEKEREREYREDPGSLQDAVGDYSDKSMETYNTEKETEKIDG